MTEITLQFVGGNSLADRAIQIFTWSWADHLDLVLPDGKLLGAVPGSGVVIREQSAIDPSSRIERYSYYVTRDQEARLYEEAKNQLGTPYDWAAIIGIAIHRDWAQTDHWICSEFQLWLSAIVGKPLLNAPKLDRITPRDLLLSPLLMKKYSNHD